MENIVDMAHCWRQGELIGLQSDASDNLVRSKASPIEFLRRTGGGDVRSVEPNHITRMEFDSLKSLVLGVIILCLSILSVLDILNEAIMDILEVQSKVRGGGSGMVGGDLEL